MIFFLKNNNPTELVDKSLLSVNYRKLAVCYLNLVHFAPK